MNTYRVAVLDDYQNVAASFADWDSLGPTAAVDFFRDHLDDEGALAQRLAPYDVVVIMRERTPFQASLLARLPSLKLLVTTGMHNHAVDLDACARRSIVVCGASGAGFTGTAELTWGLIIAAARHIPQEDRALREGRWQTTLGFGLRGKTLGVVGLGRVGAEVARLGLAFGMHVIAWSEHLTDERCAEAGVLRVDKRTLFTESDVVTLHLVLSARSRGIVGAAEVGWMKPTAVLVNTSRGPLVDTDALVQALHARRLGGAALDVYEREPLSMDDPLRSAPNMVLTPHLGYATHDSYELFFPAIVEDIAAWRSGHPLRVIAGPHEALAH